MRKILSLVIIVCLVMSLAFSYSASNTSKVFASETDGVNLFNKETATNGHLVFYNDGLIYAGADYCVSDYIPVVAGEKYCITYPDHSAIYNSNKQYIFGCPYNSWDNPITIPAGGAYIRLSCLMTEKDTQKFEKGLVITPYSPYMATPTPTPTTTPAPTPSVIPSSHAMNTVNVAKSGGDFTTISQAVASITDDTEANPYVIIVHPGTYEEVVHIPGNRYISIVGTDRRSCILRNDSGDYASSPLYLEGGGYVANMTIIATHDDNPSNINGQSYAVHADGTYGGTVELFNCKLVSYQMAALGSGLYQDKTIKLVQCELYSYTDPESTNVNLGALICHSSIPTTLTNQHLIVKDCYIYSENGKTAVIQNVGGAAGMDVSFYHTICYSDALGKDASVRFDYSTITLNPDSFGNNVSVFNAP